MGKLPFDGPDELNKEIDISTMVQVWEDDRGDEIDLYYISPIWFIPDSVNDFYEEKKHNEKNQIKLEYWQMSSRYKLACDRFDYWVEYWKNPDNNRKGFA